MSLTVSYVARRGAGYSNAWHATVERHLAGFAAWARVELPLLRTGRRLPPRLTRARAVAAAYLKDYVGLTHAEVAMVLGARHRETAAGWVRRGRRECQRNTALLPQVALS